LPKEAKDYKELFDKLKLFWFDKAGDDVGFYFLIPDQKTREFLIFVHKKCNSILMFSYLNINLYFLQESDKEKLNKLTEELEHKTFDELFGDDILFGKINNFFKNKFKNFHATLNNYNNHHLQQKLFRIRNINLATMVKNKFKIFLLNYHSNSTIFYKF